MRAFLNAITEIPRAEEHPRGGTAQYRCDLDNIDLGEAVVLNGAGRVAANASGRLLVAEQKAQAAGRGIWRE